MKELKTCRDLMRVLSDGHTVEVESACGEKWSTVMEFRFDVTKLDDELLFEYRIKPTKPSINWGHVDPRYKYLARDENGNVYLYTEEPVKCVHIWDSDGGMACRADSHITLTVGNCDWTESLVERTQEAKKRIGC